ncbi:hypothetical protein HPP92_010637 [Vanilla planifolia]|uniref:DYW domain-containing protein n=1 Tax=Vanilla planifolia TaxID=51239 RepID=A0A835QW30_VANPL|nr:hypothetical protein HPP92_010637 [Vanilla planifolia]
MLEEAVSALESGSVITARTYLLLLQACIDNESIDAGRQLHLSLPSVKDTNPFVETKLVSMYTKCGSLDEARQVFENMRQRNLFAWSAMIGGCVRESRWEEVVELFYRMIREGVNPDAFLLPKILQACSKIEDVTTGRLIHSLAIRLGFLEETYVGNSILSMYAKCGELNMAKETFDQLNVKNAVTWNSIISAHSLCGKNDEAFKLFKQMRNAGIEPGVVTWNILISGSNQSGKPILALELMKEMEKSRIAPDVFTWTCMISGLLQNNKIHQALDLFQEMWTSGVNPNNMTVASVISVCATLKYLKNGRELHGYAIKIGGSTNLLVLNSLIDLYGKCRKLEDAERIFNCCDDKDIFTLNSMIRVYMQEGYCGKAHELFLRMKTFCHQQNVVTWNVMISGYIQNREDDQAIQLFQRMEVEGVRKNAATWNALISGFLQNGKTNSAFRVFRQMQLSEKPNSITILTLLPSCANLVSAWKVKEIHAYVLRSCLHHDLPIGNSLINAYAKSGDIAIAQALFNTLQHRDFISWNSIIAGCILHGNSHAAQELFRRMSHDSVKPDQTSHISMIYAYGLEGLVNDGKELFKRMIELYPSPCMSLYSAMIELFGRSRRLAEAYRVIKEMPVEPDSSVWNSFLTAARFCGNTKLEAIAAEQLSRLEPKILMIQELASQLEAAWTNSSEVSNVKKPQKSKNGFDINSCCLLEDGPKLHVFCSDTTPVFESTSPKFKEFIWLRKEINARIPDFMDAWGAIEEEWEDDEFHCERKAILFSLLNKPPFKVIRIIKNVSMCTRCHATAKLVSKVYRRVILIKDGTSLHHFRDGKCSCKDYW